LWTINSDGSEEQKISGSDWQEWSPAVAPDKTSIVFLSTRSGSKQIWKSTTMGRREAVQLSHVGNRH
jgi:Tol biopolymer transport system component